MALSLLCGAQGRIGILKVHARDKELEDDVDFHKVARATAGSTGAELMNLMNQSAIVTVRQGRDKITEADVFEVSHCMICLWTDLAQSVNAFLHASVGGNADRTLDTGPNGVCQAVVLNELCLYTCERQHLLECACFYSYTGLQDTD